MIQISGECINQKLTTILQGIFRSLLTEPLSLSVYQIYQSLPFTKYIYIYIIGK